MLLAVVLGRSSEVLCCPVGHPRVVAVRRLDRCAARRDKASVCPERSAVNVAQLSEAPSSGPPATSYAHIFPPVPVSENAVVAAAPTAPDLPCAHRPHARLLRQKIDQISGTRCTGRLPRSHRAEWGAYPCRGKRRDHRYRSSRNWSSCQQLGARPVSRLTGCAERK